ncbi:MAG: high-affinity nickel-transport family protein [Acidobacteriota bacterium]
MTTTASIVALGFLLGVRHATDVDHVVAVATIVSRQRMVKFAALVGALWGLGHTLTIVLVGAPIILFNWAVAPRVGLAMEFAVGCMLVLLGLRNLPLRWSRPALAGSRGPSAVHAHGDYVHAHVQESVPGAHPHPPGDTPLGRLDRAFGGMGLYQTARPVVVGTVHGLAGSAAVALLVLTTIRDPRWAVAYLALFGVGTVAGMVLITTVMALPIARAGCSAATHQRLRVATGLLSLAFGLFLAYKVGVVDGLFSAAPRWDPQ